MGAETEDGVVSDTSHMSSTNPPTVLVVEDETPLANLYSSFLSERYDVRTAMDGETALEKADEAVDVALLDRRMPGMKGDEVLEEFRSRGFEMQVAMVTGVDPDVDIVEMPFDDYVVKPAGQSDLVGVVETLLRRREYDDRSREFFSLASKKAALELSDKTDTAEYDDLMERMAELRADLDATLDELSTEGALAEALSG